MSNAGPTKARSSRAGARESAAIIDELARGDHSPAQIAQRHGMTLDQLTRWAARPTTARRLANVRRLADERAALAVSAARVAAAHALRELALSAENPETARRACVDLLKLDTNPTSAHENNPPETSPDIAAESRDAIRALLEHLEARADNDARAEAAPDAGADA